MPAGQETSNRIRLRWLPTIVLLLALLTVISAYVSMQLARHHNLEIATEGARNIFRMAVITRQWNADHGGVYVLVDPKTQPNPFLAHEKRDIQDQFGRQLTLMNPAFMTREIAEVAERSGHLFLHITSLKPIRPTNQADDWETAALQAFEQGTEEVYSVENFGGRQSLRYMAVLKVNQSCMSCHEQQGYRVGDVRGGISVSVDFTAIEASMNKDLRTLVITHVLFFLTAALLSALLLEILRRRWMSLDETIETLQTTRDELISSEKMASLGRLVAGFAHEINTPMGVAVSAISHGQDSLQSLEQLLTQDEVTAEALHAPLEALRESQRLALANLRRGADLVHRFKRTSVDQGSAEKRQFSLTEAIQDVLATLHTVLKRLPVKVQVNCPAELSIYGTPGLIEQLLTNFVMNSVLHGFDDGARSGSILIEARERSAEGQLEIHYADDGTGIAPEILGKIFEPFTTTRRGKGGSGLGLFIVYNIVTRDLGGSIRCESTAGHGTHFLIDIPIQKSATASTTPSPPPGVVP